MNLTLPNPLIDLWFSLFLYTWIQTSMLTSTFQHSHTSLLWFLSMFKAHSEHISPSSCWRRQFTVTCLWPLAFPQDLCEASDWNWQWLGGDQVGQRCFVPWSHSAHLSTSWLEILPGTLCMYKVAFLLNMSNVFSPAVKLVLKWDAGGGYWEGWLEPLVNYHIPGLLITVTAQPWTVNLKNCFSFVEAISLQHKCPGLDVKC